MKPMPLKCAGLLATTLMLSLACQAVAQPPAFTPEMMRAMAAEMQRYNALPDTQGTGPYPALKEESALLPHYVLYRPANLSALGKRKLGILTWGNGGCMADGASARLHLSEIASHGYLAIAPGTIRTGPGSTPVPAEAPRAMEGGKFPPIQTTSGDLIKAIDWAVAENGRKASPWFHKLDPGRIAVAGHSCGGLQALQAAADPRVKAVIINNSGIFAGGKSPMTGMTIDKPALKLLHTPVIYILGGPTDIAYANGMDDFARIDHVPVMVANLAVGHGGTFSQPNGGVVAQVSLDWLAWQLSGDKSAAARFSGTHCGLCTDPGWTVQRKKIK
ncbi:MAG: hypothetical protein RL367_868 [Pseudomonadota bacterium]